MNDLIDPKRLANEAGYKIWAEERVRQFDTDMQNHVNNAVFATYFEIARSAMAPMLALRPAGSFSIVARQVIHYHAELTYPATIRIGVAVARLGTRSYDLAHAIFRDGACIATGEIAHVLFDGATRRSLPLPEAFRKALEEQLLP
jgi:acyl-CoA thioester hydrolase